MFEINPNKVRYLNGIRKHKLLTKELEARFKRVGRQEDDRNPIVVVKYFNPYGKATWYATEYYPEDRSFFGYVSLFGDHEAEWGYFSLDELEHLSIKVSSRLFSRECELPIERECYTSEKRIWEWVPKLKPEGSDPTKPCKREIEEDEEGEDESGLHFEGGEIFSPPENATPSVTDILVETRKLLGCNVSHKLIVPKGDASYENRDTLGELGFRWIPRTRWERRFDESAFTQARSIPGLEVKNLIIVDGKTFPHRELLSSLGFHFNFGERWHELDLTTLHITAEKPVEIKEPVSATAEVTPTVNPDIIPTKAATDTPRELPEEISGAKTRMEINRQVIELLENKPEGSGFSEEEKDILRKYTGKGGLVTKGETGKGVLSEFYTPYQIIEAMWKLANGFAGENLRVIEPAAGNGRFAGYGKYGSIDMIEVEPVSARIARILYPHATVTNVAFQTLFLDKYNRPQAFDGKLYDLVIGNPPYGTYSGVYMNLEGKGSKYYENYFVNRSLDVLKDGGFAVLLLPSEFLNRTSDEKGKREIAAKGKLIQAFRLPAGLFANTDVGTDIVVLRKGNDGDVFDFLGGSYFVMNPENILGEIVETTDRFGKPAFKVVGDMSALELIEFPGAVPANQPEEKPEVKPDTKPVQTAGAFPGKSTGNADGRKNGNPAGTVSVPKVKKQVEPNKVTGQKKETYTAEEFLKKYNREFSDRELALWAITLVDGSLDVSIGEVKAKYLGYVNYRRGRFYHDFNYVTGDIYDAMIDLEFDRAYICEDLGESQYEKQKGLLQRSLPGRKKVDEIFLEPISNFSQSITFEGKSLINLFKDWISNVPTSELKGAASWDIVSYVNQDPVRGRDKDDNQARRRLRKLVGDELFNRFIREELSEGWRNYIENLYNRRFNAFNEVDYAKIPLALNGVSKTFKGKELRIKPVQIRGAAFLGNKGAGCLAYDVGVGKTLTGILAVMNALQKGWAKRPILVTPKAVYKNWIREIKDLFPGVAVNDLGNLGEGYLDNLKKVEDGTLSIVTYEGFTRIGYTEETFNELTWNLQDVMRDVNLDGSKSKKDLRRIEKEKEKIDGKAGVALLDVRINVEDLGFDLICVDEAHNFKNVFERAACSDEEEGYQNQRANEYSLLGGSSSIRGVKMYLFCQYILKNYGRRNVYLLSATPFTNQPIEIYSVLSLMAKYRLERMGIENVNDFMSLFTDVKYEYVCKGNGNVVMQQVVKNFKNLQALQMLIREFFDFRTGEEAGIERPNKIAHSIELPLTDVQIAQRAEAEKYYDKGNGKKNDAKALVAINNQRMSALSPMLLEDDLGLDFVKDSPKLLFTLNSVGKLYQMAPHVGQVIYLPRGVDFFKIAIEYLNKQFGISYRHIACIESGTSESRKASIQDDFNNPEGDIKILFGSETIKEGVNLQGNSVVLYNTFLGWNSTELVQVEGRSWRQGNVHENVNIVYPLMVDSIDSVMFQKHSEKISRLGDLWSYKGSVMEIQGLDPEELKFDLIQDPERKARFFIQVERDKLLGEGREIVAKVEIVDKILSDHSELQKKNDWLKVYIENDVAEMNATEGYKKEQLEDRINRQKRSIEENCKRMQDLEKKLWRRDLDLATAAGEVERLKVRCEELSKEADLLEDKEEELAERFRKEKEAKAKTLPSLEEIIENHVAKILSSIRTTNEYDEEQEELAA